MPHRSYEQCIGYLLFSLLIRSCSNIQKITFVKSAMNRSVKKSLFWTGSQNVVRIRVKKQKPTLASGQIFQKSDKSFDENRFSFLGGQLSSLSSLQVLFYFSEYSYSLPLLTTVMDG